LNYGVSQRNIFETSLDCILTHITMSAGRYLLTEEAYLADDTSIVYNFNVEIIITE